MRRNEEEEEENDMHTPYNAYYANLWIAAMMT